MENFYFSKLFQIRLIPIIQNNFLSIKYCCFLNINSGSLIGVCYINSNTVNIEIDNCYFKDCISTSAFGGYYSISNKVNIKNIVFNSCKSKYAANTKPAGAFFINTIDSFNIELISLINIDGTEIHGPFSFTSNNGIYSNINISNTITSYSNYYISGIYAQSCSNINGIYCNFYNNTGNCEFLFDSCSLSNFSYHSFVKKKGNYIIVSYRGIQPLIYNSLFYNNEIIKIFTHSSPTTKLILNNCYFDLIYSSDLFTINIETISCFFNIQNLITSKFQTFYLNNCPNYITIKKRKNIFKIFQILIFNLLI